MTIVDEETKQIIQSKPICPLCGCDLDVLHSTDLSIFETEIFVNHHSNYPMPNCNYTKVLRTFNHNESKEWWLENF